MAHYKEVERRSELRFPTMAEEVLEIVKTCGYTMSVAGLALFNGAHRSYDQDEHCRRVTVYQFDDESIIETVGRGKSYEAKARLP